VGVAVAGTAVAVAVGAGGLVAVGGCVGWAARAVGAGVGGCVAGAMGARVAVQVATTRTLVGSAVGLGRRLQPASRRPARMNRIVRCANREDGRNCPVMRVNLLIETDS